MSGENYYFICKYCKGRDKSLWNCVICDKEAKRLLIPYLTFCSKECVEDHKKEEHLSVNMV